MDSPSERGAFNSCPLSLGERARVRGNLAIHTRIQQRRSFYTALYGQTWVNFKDSCMGLVAELIRINRNKQSFFCFHIHTCDIMSGKSLTIKPRFESTNENQLTLE
jgi:hypothetical protein